MKYLSLILLVALISGCGTAHYAPGTTTFAQGIESNDPPITQSLFNDKSSTISEENIKKVLDGNYELPNKVRVAVIKLDNNQRQSFLWNDEDYIKNQQSYLETITDQLKKSARVSKVTIMPDLMVTKPVSMTNLREAGVRMQADILVIFSSLTDIYSKYKLFTKTDIKAFATTQVVVLDTRTALVPFTYISTKDVLSKKGDSDLDILEARKRIQNEAVTMTINDVGAKLVEYLQ